ncbi:MAG: efflux RND transporter permease subunit [Planctomycetes bacterium]|nr:efflux RND transporter permease subunit [Planctomycetota bacterium]
MSTEREGTAERESFDAPPSRGGLVASLVRIALARRFAVLVISVVVLIAGGFVARTLPIDVFPDLTAPTVTVLTEGHGMVPEEMERLVTVPIEAAVNGAPGMRRVRSATAIGISVVWVEFEWGIDPARARQIVAERLGPLTGRLPDDVRPPVIAPASSIMGEIVFVALTSDQHDPIALRSYAVNELRRRLHAVRGVSQVTPIGGDAKQIQVLLDPARLAAHGLGVDQVADAIASANANVSAGIVVDGGQEVLLRGVGRLRDPTDVAATVVRSNDDTPVLVRDVGEVTLGAGQKRGEAMASWREADGSPRSARAVILAIQKQPGANTLELTKRLDETFSAVRSELQPGMRLHDRLFRQATFIDAAIDNTVAALIEGAVMVLLVVVVFLLSGRASLVTLLAIPLSLATTILVLAWSDVGVNTMTLGGMAIAIGALVDDAIIDVENVARRLRENALRPLELRQSTLRVVFDASIEVRSSIVVATAIILLVFAPLFFLSGIEGRLLRPLGIAFCVALAASLLTAITLTPVLCSWLLPSSRGVRRGREPWTARALASLYRRPLEAALNRPFAVLGATLVLLIGAGFACARVGVEFLPPFQEGALVVGAVTVPGTALAESDAMMQRVEAVLMKHPEVATIGRRTGRAEEDEHVLGAEASELEITLDFAEARARGAPQRSPAELLAALREEVAAIPGVQFSFGQPIGHRIDHLLSGTRAAVAVKIYGDDLDVLRTAAARVEAAMRPIAGTVDLAAESQSTVAQLRVEYDRRALARHGLTVDAANRALAATGRGEEATAILEGAAAVPVVVRTASATMPSSAIADTYVDSARGARVPLKAVASIEPDRGPNFISRENVRRTISVTCNVQGRDLGSVVDEVRAAITKDGVVPRGCTWEIGGQFATAMETQRRLAWLSIAVVLGVGFLLHQTFRSSRDAVFVLLNLPLALIGGVLGVYAGGGVLSVASLIGFITVFGVAARNGIMLVSHVRHLQETGEARTLRDAVTRGSIERLPPIVMTALAAGLALIPLALRGDEPGTEILVPMARVILFGLLSSTILNMIVVPALYLRFGRGIASTTEDV